MSNAVATTSPDQLPLAPAASESAAILSVIERMALNPEISPDRVERFIALKRQVDADAARREFDAAIAEAKAEISPVLKNREGHNGKRYADFAAIAKAVDPIITKHGLSYRFRTQQTDRITVTCVLSHKAGHFEETSLSGPADASGSKNAIQAIGSTLTYLQRYSLVQALGLAAAEDDDGKAGGIGSTITDEQRDRLLALIEETGSDVQKFCAVYGIEAIADLPAATYPVAERMLLLKRKPKAEPEK